MIRFGIAVESVARAILELSEATPLVLLGHSLGGLLAFETLHRLRQSGLRRPAFLFVSACSAPHLQGRWSDLHLRSDAELIHMLKAFGGMPEPLLADRQLLSLFLPTIRADLTLLADYRWTERSAIDVPISLLHGREDRLILDSADLLGWQQHSTSSIALHQFGGAHFFLYAQLLAVAALIEEALRVADNRSEPT